MKKNLNTEEICRQNRKIANKLSKEDRQRLLDEALEIINSQKYAKEIKSKGH